MEQRGCATKLCGQRSIVLRTLSSNAGHRQSSKKARRQCRHGEVDVGDLEADVSDLLAPNAGRVGGTAKGALYALQHGTSTIEPAAHSLRHEVGGATGH